MGSIREVLIDTVLNVLLTIVNCVPLLTSVLNVKKDFISIQNQADVSLTVEMDTLRISLLRNVPCVTEAKLPLVLTTTQRLFLVLISITEEIFSTLSPTNV
jgi:hypothetical protein